jgi:hypothetical protein
MLTAVRTLRLVDKPPPARLTLRAAGWEALLVNGAVQLSGSEVQSTFSFLASQFAKA